MYVKRTLIILTAVCMLSSVSAFASDEAKPKLKIKGKIYANWHTNMTENGDSAQDDGNKKNTFELERVYLTLKKKLSDVWSVRATTDVGNETVVEDGKETQKYKLYIKYAYGQAKKSFGPLDIKLQFGMIATPMIGFIDKLADQRWVHKNFIDDAKGILPAYGSIDNSADMGTSLNIKIMKMVEVSAAVTNGEGYKKTDESEHDSSNEGKAYYGRLTINPLKSLYISGFYRREGLNTKEADDHKGYYGGGIAWKDKAIMIGGNYLVPFAKEAGEKKAKSGEEYDMSLVDVWLTVKMKSLINIPLFIMARYGLGDTGLENGKTAFIGAGLGYQFDKNVRAIAWYQQYDNEADEEAEDANPEKTFYVKAEIKI